MKRLKKLTALILSLTLALSLFCISASAKTVAAGQTVGTVLFYVENNEGEEILVSHVTVEEMEADMAAGKIDTTNHNYSLLDRFVTTVHQEAQGFTVAEFVEYAQSKSAVEAIKDLDTVASALFAQRVQRAVAEQTVEILRMLRFMAGEILAFLMLEK